MQAFIIFISTFCASLISFYSGFGLGTLLMPVMALFVPLPLAIGSTAIVHLFHNLLKAWMLRRAIRWDVVLRFGLAAMACAIPGAWLLAQLSDLPVLGRYQIMGITAEVSILHILIGLLLIFFAVMESIPHKKLSMKSLWLGGAISGFFGGLSGNQGAFRSLFLVNMHLEKEAFIGSNAMIACAVDTVRLLVYSLSFQQMITTVPKPLLLLAMVGALAGVVLGIQMLHKVTIAMIQKLIIGLLVLFGFLMVVGLI